MSPQHSVLRGRHVALFSWRDTRNPEGGGAERYLEQMAAGLVARGAQVTLFCADFPGAAPQEEIDGIRYVRRGSKLGVYGRGMLWLLRRRRTVDAVVDVQNGIPFFTRAVTRRPVTVLIHHVHREQWPVVYPGLMGKVGWWVERWFAPHLYRRCRYVVVSEATREELALLGVDEERITVVRNGTDPETVLDLPKTPDPSMCVVGRLVPHKRIEQAIEAVADLGPRLPGLTLTVVGSGWWEDHLREHVERLGVADRVHFTGFVGEYRKHEVYRRSWVMALPSLKEGWGLVVGEAAMHETPTVAYRSAGGTRESIVDGVTGFLVDDQPEFTAALGRLLGDETLRMSFARAAKDHGGQFDWGFAQAAFAAVIAEQITESGSGTARHSVAP